MKCINCGCSMINGLCSNCDEEACIFENQHDYLGDYLSDEFIEKVKYQLAKRKKAKIKIEVIKWK